MAYSLESFRAFGRIYRPAGVDEPTNIHTSDDFAQSVGLRSAMGFGTQPTAQVIRLVMENFGADRATTEEISLRFLRPFYSGDTLTVNGRLLDVTDVCQLPALKEMMIDVWCDDQEGRRIAEGKAVARVRLDV